MPSPLRKEAFVFLSKEAAAAREVCASINSGDDESTCSLEVSPSRPLASSKKPSLLFGFESEGDASDCEEPPPTDYIPGIQISSYEEKDSTSATRPPAPKTHSRASGNCAWCGNRLLWLGTAFFLAGTLCSCAFCLVIAKAILVQRRRACPSSGILNPAAVKGNRLAEIPEVQAAVAFLIRIARRLGLQPRGEEVGVEQPLAARRKKRREEVEEERADLERALPLDRNPEMYGKVKEKTIWAYWTHVKDCPSSRMCTLPASIQLCTETVRRNRGGFDYRIVHEDEVLRYVTRLELPLRFFEMLPVQKKDALMNALLARYGGVALDISTVLLRPLDEYWDEMMAEGATFWGYMYRITGLAWSGSEVLAVWFLMSRREGIFSSAVRSQILGMGDRRHPPHVWQEGYHNPYFAMGDQTLTPLVSMFNYSFPKCFGDPKVKRKKGSALCPERESPRWNYSMPGPPRNDAKLLLREPRLGPQLPYAFDDGFGMPMWRVGSNESVKVTHSPKCCSMKDCWDNVFLPRFFGRAGPRRTRRLNFVKLFNSGGKKMKNMSRSELLADNGTYFYHWLLFAGLEGIG